MTRCGQDHVHVLWAAFCSRQFVPEITLSSNNPLIVKV